jgi:hypothetical protein
MQRAVRIMTLVIGILHWSVARSAVAEPVDADAYCSDDSYYWVHEPEGWQQTDSPAEDPYSILFQPSGPNPDVTISVKVRGSEREKPDTDPRDLLSDVIVTVSTFIGASPSPIRELKIAHPSMPSAGASFKGDTGTVDIVAVVVPRGGGSFALFSLTRKDGEASAKDLDASALLWPHSGMTPTSNATPPRAIYLKRDRCIARRIRMEIPKAPRRPQICSGRARGMRPTVSRCGGRPAAVSH